MVIYLLGYIEEAAVCDFFANENLMVITLWDNKDHAYCPEGKDSSGKKMLNEFRSL